MIYLQSDNDDLRGTKYYELDSLGEAGEYIKKTYGEHYAGNNEFQTFDYWETLGTLETTARDTAIKYLARYGKKGGKNRKDLLKAIHYITLMMYINTKEGAPTTSVPVLLNETFGLIPRTEGAN